MESYLSYRTPERWPSFGFWLAPRIYHLGFDPLRSRPSASKKSTSPTQSSRRPALRSAVLQNPDFGRIFGITVVIIWEFLRIFAVAIETGRQKWRRSGAGFGVDQSRGWSALRSSR